MLWRTWREAFEDLRRGPVLEELGHAVQRSHLWRIAEHLDAARLQRVEDDELLDPDLFMGGVADRAAPLFLGRYSTDGLEYALGRYGLWQRLAERARGALAIGIDGLGDSVQTLRIGDGGEQPLVELRAGLVSGDLDGPGGLPLTERPWLSIEWLCLQDPHRPFRADRQPLPGQDHPGLGVGREVMELLLIMGWRLGCAGLIGHPAWFHNAVMYRIHYRFLDPAEEGRMLALLRAWQESGLSLAAFSWAMDRGRVVDEARTPTAWKPGLMVAPLAQEGEFQDSAWDDAVERARSQRFDVLAD